MTRPAPSRRRPRRRRLLLPALVALLAATLAQAWWRLPDPFTGPADQQAGTRISLSAGTGEPVAVVVGFLDSDGDPVTIRSVGLIGARGVQVLGVEMRPLTRSAVIGAQRRFPTIGQPGAGDGIALPDRLTGPAGRYQVVLGVRRDGAGEGFVHGVVLHYTAAGLPHTRTLRTSVRLILQRAR